MVDLGAVGVYGKIPTHGDFLNLNLPNDFLEGWDHWMQQSVLASQEVLGESWLTHFLISPVWRFVLPSGCVNSQSWAGIMLPSVDKVGRYYPLTLAAAIPEQVGSFEYISNAESWFQCLESVAIMTLEKGLDADELLQALVLNEETPVFPKARPLALKPARNLQCVVPLGSVENAPQNVIPQLCDALIKPQLSSVSLWWTKGGEHVEASLLLADQLPRPVSYTAMLNGQWANWHWPSFYQPVTG